MLEISPLLHKQTLCIKIDGVYQNDCVPFIRQLQGIRYSKTFGCWYLHFSAAAYAMIRNELSASVPLTFVDNEEQHLPCSLFDDEVINEIISLPPGYVETLKRLRYSERTIENYTIVTS